MLSFNRAKIMPLFLSKQMTVAELAGKAGICHQSAQQAIEGKNVSEPIIGKVAEALGIDAVGFLCIDGKSVIRDLTNPQEKVLLQCTLSDLNSVVKSKEREGYKLIALDRMTSDEVFLTFEQARN